MTAPRLPKTHEQIRVELEALGWTITKGPVRTASGWKATMERGSKSILQCSFNKQSLYEDLLKYAKASEEKKP